MVRAILDGRKTQTRRVVKTFGGETFNGIHNAGMGGPGGGLWWDGWWSGTAKINRFRCPYGVPGDVLWVKETLRRAPHAWTYGADGAEVPYPGRAAIAGLKREVIVSIHCRRDCSRINLRITDVRVERLHDLNEADAIAEGYPADCVWTPNVWYAQLWATINGLASWDANPWVWVVAFEPAAARARSEHSSHPQVEWEKGS